MNEMESCERLGSVKEVKTTVEAEIYGDRKGVKTGPEGVGEEVTYRLPRKMLRLV